MVGTITRTLEATLAPPTQGKEVRLKRLLSTYREALHDAFDSRASTMSSVNSIVTPYDLPYQAKDAIKSHVPILRNSLGAKELDPGQPLRLVNRAAKFDRDESRHHEICWNVPQPGRGTNFWIPLRINPEQKPLWHGLLGGDITAGEIQLQQESDHWVFRIHINYDVGDHDAEGDKTYVGFDIGESALITGCALKRDTPTSPMVENGNHARTLRKEMYTVMKRLQEREASQWRIEERFDHYQNALTDIVEKASRKAVEYAGEFENPTVVMEDLTHILENLDYGQYMNRRLHAWAFRRLQLRIEDKAEELGIPVVKVNPAYTSQTCHACRQLGRRRNQAEFRCNNDGCHIGEFQADINAAANIANRADPWGESVPWKPERNDSPRDGSTRDSATAPREKSAKLAQMTLSEYSG